MKRHFFTVLLFIIPLSSLGQAGSDANKSCVQVVDPISLLSHSEYRQVQKFATSVSQVLRKGPFQEEERVSRGIIVEGEEMQIHFKYASGLNFVVLVDLYFRVIFGYLAPDGSKNGVTRTEVKPWVL